MKVTELAGLKRKLIELQNRLDLESDSRMESLLEVLHPTGDLTNVPTHAADRDVEGLDSQIAVGNLEETLRQRVTAALDRMKSGEYGTCLRCGYSIPLVRLTAIPETPFCIDCERQAEAETNREER